MGYTVTFESGHSVSFDNEPTQADIDEAEASFMPTTSVTAPNKRDTTLGEDVQIGIGNAASTLVKGAGLLAAGGIGRMLPQSVQDQMFEMTGDIAKDTTEYWTPKDAKQTLGGKLTTAITTLPIQMMAMPFSPADTGMTMIEDGEDVKTAMLGATMDTIGNAGGMLMGNGSGGILSRMALGAVGNAGQELATKQIMQSLVEQDASKEKWAPNTDDALVAGVMGAGFGMLPNKPAAPKLDKTPSKPILEKPFGETTIANELLSTLDKEIATQSASLNRLNDLYAKNNIPIVGEDSPIVKLEKELAHLKLQRESLAKDLDGNIEDRTATEEAIKNRAPDKIASARTQRLLDTINKKIADITNSIYQSDSDNPIHQAAIGNKQQEIDRLTRQKDMLEVLLGGKKREEVPTNNLVPDDAEARAMASIEAVKTMEHEGVRPEKNTNGYPTDYRPTTVEELRGDSYGQLILDKVKAAGKTEDEFQQWLTDAWNTSEEVLKAEKHTPIPRDLWDKLYTMSGEAWSKLRGYTPEEIATYIKNIELLESGKKLFGLTEDDIIGLIDAPGYHPDYNALWKEGKHPNQLSNHTPWVVANQKIDQAAGMSVAERADRILETEEKLANTPPEKTALREALAYEIKTLEEMNRPYEDTNLSNIEAAKEEVSGLWAEGSHLQRGFASGLIDAYRNHEILDYIKAFISDSSKISDPNRPHLLDPDGNYYPWPWEEFRTGTLPKFLEHFDDVASKQFSKELYEQIELIAEKHGIKKKPDQFTATEIPREPIKNKINPSSDEVTQLLLDHKTVGEVLETLRKEDLGTPAQKILIQILQKIGHVTRAAFAVKAAEIFDKNGKPASGMYTSGVAHEVAIHPGATIKTILHEAVHAATVAVLDHGTNVYAQRMNVLYEKYKHLDKGEYGFTNVKEFVSEALTNKSFQTLLAGIKSDTILGKTPTSLWTSLKRTIADALGVPPEVRTALDDILDASSEVMNKTHIAGEKFFKKMSEAEGDKVSYDKLDAVVPRTFRRIIGRNAFGINSLEGFYRDKPKVQKAYKLIMQASDYADRVTNQLWNGTANVLNSTKQGFWKSLSKIEDPDSPIVVVKTLSNESMANLHDVFKIGKELELDHTTNLKQNGQHLTPLEQKSYTILAKLFDDMHTEALKKQQALGLKHELPYTQGWYAASRRGQYSIAISYGDLIAHYETFATRRAAESALANLKNNHKFKFLEVSDIMDASKGQEKTPNKEMAEAIATKLEQTFASAGPKIREEIAKMVENMEKKNGKLGHHHEHRSNVSGYKGSEIGLTRAERGKSFKEGIQLEVTNFTSNIKALDIKTKLKAYVENADEQTKSPIEHAAISQMYDSQLGRNAALFGDKIDGVAEHVTSSIDRMANNVMMKTLGIEFKGREKSILKGGYEAAMRGFYATKLLAKPMFALGQVLTTAMIIPEMAQNNHPIRAFYSFGKGMTKLLAHDKKLMDVLFRESQEYGTIEPQLRESLGLDRHTGIESNVAKTVNAIEDYALLGKLGTMADSLSRAVSFATAYTHFTDLGMGETQARYEARRITGHAMNENGKNMAAPMYSKMGVVGEAMRPLTSFSQNQLGNLAKYYKQMLKGDAGPILAVGLIATATGGIIGLPFMQEYERMRQIFAAMSDIQMPSMLEIMYGDESFLDRLEINPADTQMLKDAVTYGAIPALTGIDFTATGRTNETVFSVMASVVMGQQEAWKLLPILGATVDVATGVYGLQRAVRGKGTEAEDRKSVDKIISGPIGFAAKRALGAGRTRLFGENTDMLSTGASGNADIQAGDKAVVAGLFGAKTLEQRKVDQQAFEMAAEDKRIKDKLTRAKTMYVETGKPEYMQKMLALGLNQEQIVNAIQTGVYDKLVDQRIRYFRSSKGKVDTKNLLHAMEKGAM